VSCIETFKLTCDNHIPVKPATKNNNKNDNENKNGKSIFKAPLTNDNVQFTTLIVAGIEIIIVIVLYIVLLL